MRISDWSSDVCSSRSHLGAGFGGRGGDPGEPVPADARQDGDRHRPPALDHRGNGPAGGDGCRAHRRTGHARTAAGARRPVRAAVATAVRWLPGARCQDRRRRLTMPPARAIAHTAGVSSEDAVMRVVTLLLATGLLAACASQPMDPTADLPPDARSEEHTSELQSLMRISYAVFCLKKKNILQLHTTLSVSCISSHHTCISC